MSVSVSEPASVSAPNAIADILIVDDTLENIHFLSALLSQQGYRVRKAIDGQMALLAVQTLLPDLILLDINMPKMNGYEVCDRLKSNPQTRKVPVIFLSALDSATDKVKAFQRGGVDYITKPFQFEEVLARIQNQLTIQQLQTTLESQNQALQTALDDLKTLQIRHLQHEKMVSLGHLVAGMAHEINNPVSFIHCNLPHIEGYVENLMTVVKAYQRYYPDPVVPVQEAIAQVDLEFLFKDVPHLLQSMRLGTERIQEIVKSLQIFARSEEVQADWYDLHQSLDATLKILEHRLRAQPQREAIAIERKYGDLPPIHGYPGRLNQVFMNILSNAIDALEETLVQPPSADWLPRMRVRTWQADAQTIVVNIANNGKSIPPDQIPYLFNPFYTTKPIGQGTGMGLAICYQIVVEQHQGQLECRSQAGGMTEFQVTLPIRGPKVDR
jgi:signal transduction histidine kinase